MQNLFEIINSICKKIQYISDLFWNFPTNFEFYSNIPILGNFSLAIIMLLGSGIYFSFALKFIQIRKFFYSIKLLKNNHAKTGISPLASLFLSTAMRVGPGNILGVTGAISIGGPGALFWMWVSAFFGMATAFSESTLAQIFKEKNKDEYIGGLAFYGKKLLKNSTIVGFILSFMYIIYALLCFPAQGFNSISSIGQIASVISNENIPTNHPLYFISFIIIILIVSTISFGGIKRITKLTNILVPIMAIIYIITILILIAINFNKIPWFFYVVFSEAFAPNALFGGAFGIALMQGIKRGLMSNEAGQGTMTMAAAAADAKHPSEQGCIQSIGVFLDTFIICTLSAFVIIMSQAWLGETSAEWLALDRLPKFIFSIEILSPNIELNIYLKSIVALCFGLFAFTCLLGFMSFSEICAARISTNKTFINFIRILNLIVISFGILTSIVGMDLGSLWDLSDFANILIAFCNIPLLFLGFKYVKKATKHFENENTEFNSKIIGIKTTFWDNKN